MDSPPLWGSSWLTSQVQPGGDGVPARPSPKLSLFSLLLPAPAGLAGSSVFLLLNGDCMNGVPSYPGKMASSPSHIQTLAIPFSKLSLMLSLCLKIHAFPSVYLISHLESSCFKWHLLPAASCQLPLLSLGSPFSEIVCVCVCGWVCVFCLDYRLWGAKFL